MPRGSDASPGLAEFLTELQAELSKVLAPADTDEVRFSVDGVTLELDVSRTVPHSAGSPAEARPELRVLGSAANDAAASAHVQRLTVHLARKPETVAQAEPDPGTASSMPQAPMPKIER